MLNPLQPNLIQAPNNLWDAYIQSIIMPVVGLAESEVHPPFSARKGSKGQFPSWQYYRTPLHQLMQTILVADRAKPADREKHEAPPPAQSQRVVFRKLYDRRRLCA